MRGKRIQRLLALLLLMVFLAGGLPAPEARAASSKGRMINVVYDDSGSMIWGDNGVRWCRAKYAMEVFCAMMGEDDVMNIYLMSSFNVSSGEPYSDAVIPALSLKGSDANRVKKVHEMNSRFMDTPFPTVIRAGDDLLQANAGYEKWLVVITDGAFENGNRPVAQIQSALDGYNAQGIKTVFLGIGSDVAGYLPQGNPARGAYVEAAKDGPEVLQKVTAIGNQIFSYLILPDSHISRSGNTTKLNIDLPTSQLIVFAQGDDVSIGELTLDGKKLKPDAVENVKWSDVKPKGYESDARTDTSLKGVVATFNAGSRPFAAGQFSIEVKNADTVQFYYKPGVTVNCDLLYHGRPVKKGEELYAGDYEIAMNFVNPLDNSEVQSDLLNGATFTLTATNNGKDHTITEKKGSVRLEEGEVTIRVNAELPGHVNLSDSKTYKVLAELVEIRMTLEPDQMRCSAEGLKNGAGPVLLRIVEADSGKPISREVWEKINIDAEKKAGVKWEVSRGTEVGTWVLTPVVKNVKKLEYGDVSFEFRASYKVGSSPIDDSVTLQMTIEEFFAGSLKVEIAPPTGDYELDDLSATPGMPVKVFYENPQTKQMEPLTPQQAEAIKLEASSDAKVGWKLERNGQSSEWTLSPQYYRGECLITDEGAATVTVKATLEDGEYRYQGEASQQVNLKPMSLMKKIIELLKRFGVLLVILFILIGYLTKKRLRLRGLNPRCYCGEIVSGPISVKKNFWRKVLPYFNERATVSCHRGTMQCNFPNLLIESTGKTTFRIVNYRRINLNSTRIDGDTIDNANKDVLKRMRFALAGFTITSVDQYGEELGTFRFS